MKLAFLLATVLMIGCGSKPSYAAKITDDNLLLGVPGSSANKRIRLGDSGDGEIRFNDTDNKVEFSNDGTTFKGMTSLQDVKIKDLNQLPNHSFEEGVDAPSGWTSSGAVPTQETHVETIEGNERFARIDFSAASQYIESALLNKHDPVGGLCTAIIRYKGGDANIDFIIENGAAATIGSVTLASQADWVEEQIDYTCAAQMKLRIVSTADAASIDLDNFYLGSRISAGGGGGGGSTDSVVRLDQCNNHGSINSRIRRFATLRDCVGSDITYNNGTCGPGSSNTEATNGAEFLINTTGYYAISYTDCEQSAASIFGISVNSNQLTTNIESITQSHRRANSNTFADSTCFHVSWAGKLTASDVLRAHTNGNPTTTGGGVCSRVHFTITRVE